MGTRLELQAFLETVLGSIKVYFQPPPSYQIEYPCVIYRLKKIDTRFASNRPYRHKTGYDLTVIDRDPDSAIPSAIRELEATTFDRFFTSDGLNHFVFTIYF